MPVLNIAHRGGAALMPENTLAAFADAQRRGADGAELDVQLSADGVAVVHHDWRLNPGYARDARGNWVDRPAPRIRDLPLAALRRFEIGQPRPGSDYAHAHPGVRGAPGQHIPTLAEVVAQAQAAPDFRLMVELKCGGGDGPDPLALADAALAVVEAAGFLDRAIFVGFDWGALARVKQRNAAAQIWCSTDETIEAGAALFAAIAELGAAGWFPYFARLTPESVALARGHGFRLGAWTVNDPDNMRALTAMGVDAICTDRPDLLQALE